MAWVLCGAGVLDSAVWVLCGTGVLDSAVWVLCGTGVLDSAVCSDCEIGVTFTVHHCPSAEHTMMMVSTLLNQLLNANLKWNDLMWKE